MRFAGVSIQFYSRVICFAFGIRKYYGLQIKDYSPAICIHNTRTPTQHNIHRCEAYIYKALFDTRPDSISERMSARRTSIYLFSVLFCIRCILF